MKMTFRVSRNYPKFLRNRKRRIERRLAPRNWEEQLQPMIRGSNIHYELSGKIGATSYLHVRQERLAQFKSPLQLLDLGQIPMLKT
jgi:hypothetical protein